MLRVIEMLAERNVPGSESASALVTPGTRRFALLFLVCWLCASVAAPDSLAQGCAMCYTTAAAAGAAASHSLNLGILVLLIPTLVMFVGVLFYAVRRAATN